MFKQLLKYLRFSVKYPLYQIFKNRNRYISNRNFLIIASVIVAVVSAFAGILLKASIHFIESLLVNRQFLELRYQHFVFPVTGILISVVFIRFVLKRKTFEKGLTQILYNVKYRKSKVDEVHTYAHLATSAVTVSLGGSVGVEAPIAITGSALGSNIAKRLFVSPNDKALLLACGAAAGIASIFNSPIAGVVFAFEVILSQVSVSGFIPLLMAGATGALINHLFYKGQLIVFDAQPWQIENIPFYIILGVVCGIFSAYTIKIVYAFETKFGNHQLKFNKAIIQGLIVGALIIASPLLYGEGYFVINQILAGNFDVFMQNLKLQTMVSYNTMFVLFVLLTILLKPIASGLTLSAGGNGGIFAPSLFNGALTGLLVGRLLNMWLPNPVNELNFVVAGMAGLLSGVVSAPLTGIFMIAEISGGYVLFIPLMIVSAISFFVTRLFEPNSIYSKRLADFDKLQQHQDEILLADMSVASILETDFITLKPDDLIAHVQNVVSSASHHIYPVINHDGSVAGSLTFNDLKPVWLNSELLNKVKVKDLMQSANDIINIGDSLLDVKHIFDNNEEIWYIPVQENNIFCGLISKSAFLNAYKQLVQKLVLDANTAV